MVPMKWLKLSCLGLLWIVLSAALEIHPSAEFSRHALIRPKIYHGREKREISSTKEAEEGVKHVDFLTLTIPLREENIILDLRLNRDLISKNYFEKHQSHDTGYITKYPKAHEIELCHYNGNIRGVQNSWVAISTCNGIRGAIYDGQEMHYIENIPVLNQTKLTDPHVLYSHSDLKSSNFSCGSSNTPRFVPKDNVANVKNHRVRRDTSMSKVHGPYNANKQSRYIELVMVIDNKEYKALNEDVNRVYQHCKDIANIVNSLYVPLNIFIALVGVVIWSRDDEIVLESNGDKTLTNFLNYRKDRLLQEHPNDNAQLLTRMQFSEGVVGKALKGPICTFEFSGGVNVDHSNTIGVVASTVAHEMGHNLGMEHDTPECSCPTEKCIMSPSSSSSTTTTEWSSCSIEYLTVAFEHGMDYCLRNKPESLFDGPVCGNGFVEDGEQCDCGLKERCNNPCCNASTCMLHANASCATGECCDLQTCKPHTAGTMCRSADRECDLPEYCTGQSEYCPEDVYKVDGESCNKAMAYCYKGNCRSHSDQCRLLWGPSGQSSDMQCYQQNIKGNRSGNCGYNRLNMSYIKCKDENVYCGMLQCKHFNEKLEFGMESVAILSHFFISVDNAVIPCRTAIVDLGLNEVDPGLAPDGAKCGENKMCLNQKCMEIGSLRAMSTPGACPHNCYGNGVCNSKGHCHCKDGFDPPYCEYPGVGGSLDSGPASNPNVPTRITAIFWVLMLLLAPLLLILILYSYYVRKSPSYFWKRGQRRTVHCEKSIQIHINRNGQSSGGGGSANGSSTVQSLLANDKSSAEENHVVGGGPRLKDGLIGNFKGFSITPISGAKNTSSKPTPVRPAPTTPAKTPITRPAPPPHTVPVAAVKPMRIAPSAPPAPPVVNSQHVGDVSKTPPVLPPPNNQSTARPLISSPVLDNTTSSTVKELIKKDLPARPAPPVPSAAKTNRPSSTPGTLEVNLEDLEVVTKPSPKEQSMTLNRIASFISKSAQHHTSKAAEDRRDGVGTLKAAKINKDTLKNLKISDPIPLSEPTMPVNPLPLSKEQEKTVVMRAQSLRQNPKKERPSIHSFGSVRLPANRRPTSIPACSRPTSPPPCPPSQQQTATSQPHSSGKSYYNNYPANENDTEDNIYAVIEESPSEEEIKSPDNSPSKKAATLANTSGGLLNEIVNEIQARNIDSIYSTHHPTKKKSSRDDANDSSSSSPNENQLYENTSSCTDEYPKSSSSSTNSGYLMPIRNPATNKSSTPSSKIQVPEKSAPGYKPFSDSKKQITPIVQSLHTKSRLSSDSSLANSSQDTTTTAKKLAPGNKSTVSSAISKFQPDDQVKIKPSIIKPKPAPGKVNAAAKPAKAPSVASIQQKFETQAKSTPRSSFNNKTDSSRSSFKK
ncbi:disintegrin and metalloproteinase domain-containing protein 9 [Planococcus citri]|uniref:disintegrin and metalloproteinase domain-containing protein 9 n=1 Tax=Planococcus citri TaxID=170843 RepID=UPI0031F8641F